MSSLFRLSHPFHLFLAALTYLLGAGMAHYLGKPFIAAAFWLGALWGLTLFFAAYLLAEYFRSPAEPLGDAESPRQRSRLRTLLLQVSAAALVLATAFTIVMLYSRVLTLPAVLFLILIFILLMAYALPPLRLANSGYGELTLTVFLADFLPVLAFLLQTGEFHRLLLVVTFPLTFLALAYLIVCDFPTFASDQKYARLTLLVRLTWQRTVPLHHILIIIAYALFASVPLLGLPWRVFWPVFLTFPLALMQILWLRNITLGAKPLWKLLEANAAAVFGLTVYILVFTFWVR